MIREISIKNLKSFKYQKLFCANVTMLSGLNSSGKSTVLQAIRLADASIRQAGAKLNGHGSFEELLCRYADQDIISIEIIDDVSHLTSVSIKKGSSKIAHTPELLYHMHYIGAGRLGPSSFFYQEGENPLPDTVGEKGEFIVDYYLNHQDDTVDEKRRHPSSSSTRLNDNVEAWMNEIAPGVKFNFESNPLTDTSWIEVRSAKDPHAKYRTTNVGFGISYTLPIVTTLLGARQGSIILIENPEAHLHPKGQTILGELIARTAASGTQVITETHSDHLIDGIRIAVLNKLLTALQVSCMFLQANDAGLSTVTKCEVNDDGSISNWPEGFCDQSFINLSKLARRS